MTEQTHYETLNVSPYATQAEIKRAYRKLVKQFHPDSHQASASHETTAQINSAYEVIGDPQRRRSYDRALHPSRRVGNTRQQQAAAAQRQHRASHQRGQDVDAQLYQWLHQVYAPVDRYLQKILRSLQPELNHLAADPFDDDLMEDFQTYLDDCVELLGQAQRSFQSMPNPANVAGVAANLYYCLDQLGDAIDQLTYFTLNYNDSYLHTGQEMFRIAAGLRREAQQAVRQLTVNL
jgi:molecular chaperone DnaJ